MLGATNNAEAGVWTWIDAPGLASHVALPHDTPLIDVTSADGETRETSNPIQKLKMVSGRGARGVRGGRGESDETSVATVATVSYPRPRALTSYVNPFLTPEGHLTYALTWFSLAVITGVWGRKLLKR